MNLMADEGVDRPIVERLRQDGYQVWYVAEMEPGLDDDQILNQAGEDAAILITADKDFGELVYRQRLAIPVRPSPGWTGNTHSYRSPYSHTGHRPE